MVLNTANMIQDVTFLCYCPWESAFSIQGSVYNGFGGRMIEMSIQILPGWVLTKYLTSIGHLMARMK